MVGHGGRQERYHPYKHAFEIGVSVVCMTLPDDLYGCWDPDTRTIYLQPHLDQKERRSTLTHELVHAVRGDEPCATTELELRQEAVVELAAAQLLIPLDDLTSALRWCRDETELADELWVDEDLIRVRLANLTDLDKAFIDHALYGVAPEQWERTA